MVTAVILDCTHTAHFRAYVPAVGAYITCGTCGEPSLVVQHGTAVTLAEYRA